MLPLPDLTPDELSRYARHLTLPEIGMRGQRQLKAASVLMIGAGGLGSPAAMYLAAAGIGRLGMVDFDRVDASNLQRQLLHGTADVGRSKVASAGDMIARLNPHVTFDAIEKPLTANNALALIRDYDVVIDGTDNFATRYVVNDACVLLKKPNCYGSIFRFEGQASVFAVGNGPCYRCLYPRPPAPGVVPSCAEGGVLGVLPGIIGVIQATEAIKCLLGRGESLSGRLLLYDALDMRFRELKIRRDPTCPVCGDHPTITQPVDAPELCRLPVGATVSQWDLTPSEVKQRLASGTGWQLLDVREPYEAKINNLGGQLIPLGELPHRLGEIDATRPIIVHCKSGGRSAQAASLLRSAGFTQVYNLAGGILACGDLDEWVS